MTARSLLVSAIAAGLLSGVTLTAGAQTTAPATGAVDAPADNKTAADAFSRADANHDGKLTKEEAAKLPAIATKFEELDKNKDGSLTLDEFTAGFVAAT